MYISSIINLQTQLKRKNSHFNLGLCQNDPHPPPYKETPSMGSEVQTQCRREKCPLEFQIFDLQGLVINEIQDRRVKEAGMNI